MFHHHILTWHTLLSALFIHHPFDDLEFQTIMTFPLRVNQLGFPDDYFYFCIVLP